MVAILTVHFSLSILADTLTTQAATQSSISPGTVETVPGAGEFVAVLLVLGGLCAISAWVFFGLLRSPAKAVEADATPTLADAYRLAMLLFGGLLLMTLLPSVLVGVLDPTDARSLQFIGAITRGAVLAMSLIAIAALVPDGLAKIGLQVGKLSQAWRGIGALLLAAPWIYLALVASQIVFRATGLMPEQQTHETLTLIRTNVDPVAVAVATLGAVVLAPAMEEVLFRGLMQTSMVRLTKKPWVAIGASSLLFALIHPPFSIPAIFVLSAAVGYLYHRTQNLWAAIAFHVAFNAANTGLTLLMR